MPPMKRQLPVLLLLVLVLLCHIDFITSPQAGAEKSDSAKKSALLRNSMAVKETKMAKALKWIRYAGGSTKILLQVIFTIFATFQVWQSLYYSIKKTFGSIVGKEEKKGQKLLDEYMNQLALEKPVPSPTPNVTEEPVYAFFKSNLYSTIFIFVLVNVVILFYMWSQSREQTLRKQLQQADQEQGLVLLATRRSKRRRRKKKANK